MEDNKEMLVYGRSEPKCNYCEKLKELLKNKGVEYTYKDISDEQYYMEFCKLRLKTVPAVFVEGEFVGGYTEMEKKLG